MKSEEEIREKIKELEQRKRENEDAQKLEMATRRYFQIAILKWILGEE